MSGSIHGGTPFRPLGGFSNVNKHAFVQSVSRKLMNRKTDTRSILTKAMCAAVKRPVAVAHLERARELRGDIEARGWRGTRPLSLLRSSRYGGRSLPFRGVSEARSVHRGDAGESRAVLLGLSPCGEGPHGGHRRVAREASRGVLPEASAARVGGLGGGARAASGVGCVSPRRRSRRIRFRTRRSFSISSRRCSRACTTISARRSSGCWRRRWNLATCDSSPRTIQSEMSALNGSFRFSIGDVGPQRSIYVHGRCGVYGRFVPRSIPVRFFGCDESFAGRSGRGTSAGRERGGGTADFVRGRETAGRGSTRA